MPKLDMILQNPGNWVVTIKDVMHVMDNEGNACCMDSEPDQRKFLSALGKYAEQTDLEIDNETDEPHPDIDEDPVEEDLPEDKFWEDPDYDPES